jgi:hypothetical protein
VPCEECRALSSHEFRTADDLINALRVAAEEMNRGVLARLDGVAAAGTAEREALDSALESGAVPDKVRYRFRCEVCGDRFSLAADMRTGEGRWTREEV